MKRALLLALAGCTGVFSDPTGHHRGDPVVDGKLVFVTSELVQGGYLHGLDGADATCQRLAQAARLPGSYKAWLSSVGHGVADRFTHAAEPYVLVDGTPIADDWADLTHAALRHPIDLDEHGATPEPRPFFGAAVWTFTSYDATALRWEPGGTPTSNPRGDCLAWEDLAGLGMLGGFESAAAAWTSSSTGISCTERARLYCFEQ
jgi:hypothetical protein